MKRGAIQQKDKTTIVCLPNRAPKYRKRRLTELKNEIHSITVAVGYYHLLSAIARPRKHCRQYIDLRSSTTLLDLTPKQRTVDPTTGEDTLYSGDMGHTDGPKTHHTVDSQESQLVRKGKGSHRIFCDHNKTELQISNCGDFYRNSKYL